MSNSLRSSKKKLNPIVELGTFFKIDIKWTVPGADFGVDDNWKKKIREGKKKTQGRE